MLLPIPASEWRLINGAQRGNFSAFSGVVANVHLAETYVPIVSKEGQLGAVFELYTDISRELEEIDRDAQFAAGMAAAAFMLHFLALE